MGEFFLTWGRRWLGWDGFRDSGRTGGVFADKEPGHCFAAPRQRRSATCRSLTVKTFRSITLHIRAGETVAFLGPSGSGKTTLVNLLLRFYEYEQGSITLDGAELRELDRKYSRSQFGVVMQEPFLYSKTVRDNIKLARHSAADTEAIEAAAMAAIHESIESFDKKYDTLVGERGVTLSGGQRLRVAPRPHC